ncbi:MAG TPA: bifunctional lysylphosphatidylglycerol flippase/synthetase MprF [Candidatus Polarisedimenticolia bacterium]|nr:bifunctional lysylphosphatidylglycerol flippase/synthetase MprF [Candidatus Polarisedimenticolia bacterium]
MQQRIPERVGRGRAGILALRVLGSAGRWWPILLAGAVLVIGWEELRRIDFLQVRQALRSLSGRWLAVAAGLTALNFALLGCYDLITLRGTHVPRAVRWIFGTLAFAWSNFLTLGPIAGNAIRFLLYRPYAVDAAVLSAAIVANITAFSSALLACLVSVWLLPPLLAPAGALLILALFAALLGRIGRHPGTPRWLARGGRTWAALFAVAFLDWVVAAAVFAALVRATGEPAGLVPVVRAFFTGQLIGAASLLPGGLGSADAFWLARLPVGPASAGAALIAYRATYYLAPWLLACLALLVRGARAGARWLRPVPSILAILIGGGGAIMLASTASPALAHRLRILERWVPVGVVELSHLAGAATGLALLLLARGVARGYREAQRVTVAVLLVAGLIALLKGLDYEEAVILFALGGVTWSQGALFKREGRAPWLGWTAIGIAVLAVAIFAFVGFGSQASVPYEHALWWTFGFAGHADQAARFLRSLAVLGFSTVAILLYVGLRVPARFEAPAPEEIARAVRIHQERGSGTTPLMIASGDKSFFFLEDRAFCAYRVVGAYLVVFSDPTVPGGEERDFLEALMARAQEMDRRLVFYQIAPHWLPLLHDHGFSFFKLGEEAIIPLRGFSLEGARWKHFRHAVNRVEEREGFSFTVVPPDEVVRRMEELRSISDAWLKSKEAREKQFSIGAWSDAYMARFPCALVCDPRGRPVAFANLLPGPGRKELSIDLMRHSRQAPEGVMDYLFARLLLWGEQEGYETFNLGMAPLASVGESSGARLGERLAHLLFRHGEGLYNFQGLRAYKAKFHPTWVPRYMAYPGFWEWPLAVAQVSVLIAGGWRSVIQRRRGTA